MPHACHKVSTTKECGVHATFCSVSSRACCRTTPAPIPRPVRPPRQKGGASAPTFYVSPPADHTRAGGGGGSGGSGGAGGRGGRIGWGGGGGQGRCRPRTLHAPPSPPRSPLLRVVGRRGETSPPSARESPSARPVDDGWRLRCRCRRPEEPRAGGRSPPPPSPPSDAPIQGHCNHGAHDCFRASPCGPSTTPAGRCRDAPPAPPHGCQGLAWQAELPRHGLFHRRRSGGRGE